LREIAAVRRAPFLGDSPKQSFRIKNALPRSHCAINLSIEIIGDRWTLLILRDMMFDSRRHFGELLVSEERIASNVLADRLKMLVSEGLVTRRDDPTHKLKAIYSLTEKGISMFPVLAQIGLWGHSNVPNSQLNDRGFAIVAGGPKAWARFMTELRATHLGADGPKGKHKGAEASAETTVSG
jgi:DNA-binding HxlR family transcriptional regulator